MRKFLTHILSGHFVQFIIIFIIKTSVLLSRVLETSGIFVQWGGYTGAPFIVCMLFLSRYFQCHALKRHRPVDKKCNFFFLAPDFINSVISQHSGKYAWTMNNHSKCA